MSHADSNPTVSTSIDTSLDRAPTRHVTPRTLGPSVQALILAVGSRIVLAGIVWFSLRVFDRFPLYPRQLPDSFLPHHLVLDGWARWDAGHYIAIASDGYGGDNPSPHGGVGFFPLFPLLMRGAVELTRQQPTPTTLALAGIAIANLCFLLAVPLLARFAAWQSTPDAGRNAALLLCVAPLGFFFNAAYSESLFLLLCVVSLDTANRGRWWPAAVAAGLASGTRLVGLALLPALLLLAWRRSASRFERSGIALLAPMGAVAYAVYTGWAFGDPLAYFHAQATWGGWQEHVRFYAELFLRHPREALGGDPRHLVILLNLGLGVISLALLPRVWRQVDPGTALFTTLLLVVQAAATWVSLGRYLLPSIGIYLVAGALLTQPRWAGWPRDIVIVGSSLLLAWLAVLFAHGFWVV